MKSKTVFYLILLTLIASLIPAAHTQTFSVIHSFTGGTDGETPEAGVTVRGNALYGTAGGPFGGCAAVYQLSHSGSNWLFSTLATLPHNCSPEARVVFGPDGHLYGTSRQGGTYNVGTVFKLTPQSGPCKDAACYWTVNDLHDFDPGNGDGYAPGFGDLIWDQQGNIYGTTQVGGALGYGTVYELTPSGNGYTESVIHSFSGPDGWEPYAGLVFDNQGNLFGTTHAGGSNGFGTVFELTYVVGIGWTEHVLYNFQNDVRPGGLTFDSVGNLYGTTNNDYTYVSTVFELSPSGDSWVYTTLYSFSPGGGGLYRDLVFGPDGALYGATELGGTYGWGTVFKLANTQNGWQYTSLHDFEGHDGAYPDCKVTFDTEGNLYGAAMESPQLGVVWMIKP